MKHALAHEAEADAGIQAIMHIEPAHHPVAGKEAQFYFIFQDPSATFDLQRCDCTIKLLKDDQLVEQYSVQAANDSYSALGTQPLYIKTFNETGDYELELTGAPKEGAAFQPFSLHYEVAVGKDGMEGNNHHSTFTSQHFGHLIIFGGGLIACIILLIHNHIKNRKQKV